MNKKISLLLFLSLTIITLFGIMCNNQIELPIYKDESKSIEERIDDLVSRMTLEEKASQLMYESPAIERLDIPVEIIVGFFIFATISTNG